MVRNTPVFVTRDCPQPKEDDLKALKWDIASDYYHDLNGLWK